MQKQFYITTAIDYANGSPHLGHAYEKVLADLISRLETMQGKKVHFLTGLDEHGQKVQKKALALNKNPLELCDTVCQDFKALCCKLNINYTDFIRTTEDRHKKTVQSCLQKLFEAGLIYKADYKGFYSQTAEQFLQEKDKVEGQWPAIFGEVVEIVEANYFFKLSHYQEWLIDYIKNHPEFIFPKFRAKQVLEFLKDPINDLCISRPKSRLSWGIELPFDSEFVTYVWFDALLNYISAIGYEQEGFNACWPADLHIIGKDILVPAHGVYWPIMLKALNLSLPKTLLVHGWWLSEGDKMSKSKGNTVDPMELLNQFHPDVFRYFVIKEMNVGQDSDFSNELFIKRYNSDLANDLGNLLSRLLNMIDRYTNSYIPKMSIEEEPEKDLKKIFEQNGPEILTLCASYQFHTALDRIFSCIRSVNRYAEIRSPWTLAKSQDPDSLSKMQTTLAYMAEGLRISAVYLTPFMPEISAKIQNLLGSKAANLLEGALNFDSRLSGNKIGQKTILFPRIEDSPK